MYLLLIGLLGYVTNACESEYITGRTTIIMYCSEYWWQCLNTYIIFVDQLNVPQKWLFIITCIIPFVITITLF